MKNEKSWKWITYCFGLGLLFSLMACKQASDLKAFTEARYTLHSVSDTYVNNIDLANKTSPKDLSFRDGDSLLAAIYTNKLRLSTTLQLHVQMKEPEVTRSMTITKLKWLLLVDGKETLKGDVNEQLELTDGLNTLSVNSSVNMAEHDRMPNFEGLSKLVLLISQQQNMRQHLTFQIKPTIQTAVGKIEVPKYITVSQPAAVAIASGAD